MHKSAVTSLCDAYSVPVNCRSFVRYSRDCEHSDGADFMPAHVSCLHPPPRHDVISATLLTAYVGQGTSWSAAVLIQSQPNSCTVQSLLRYRISYRHNCKGKVHPRTGLEDPEVEQR